MRKRSLRGPPRKDFLAQFPGARRSDPPQRSFAAVTGGGREKQREWGDVCWDGRRGMMPPPPLCLLPLCFFALQGGRPADTDTAPRLIGSQKSWVWTKEVYCIAHLFQFETAPILYSSPGTISKVAFALIWRVAFNFRLVHEAVHTLYWWGENHYS